MGIEDKKPGDRVYFVDSFLGKTSVSSAVLEKETALQYTFSYWVGPWNKKQFHKKFDLEAIEALHWSPEAALTAFIAKLDAEIADRQERRAQACELLAKAEQKA